MRITSQQVRGTLHEAEEFVVTEDHLKLMRRMYVDWQNCETGAPEINPKRPYGNSSVAFDVAEILGWPIPDDEKMSDAKYEKAVAALEARAASIHAETAVVLQIALHTGQFKAGTYRRREFMGKWEAAKHTK